MPSFKLELNLREYLWGVRWDQKRTKKALVCLLLEKATPHPAAILLNLNAPNFKWNWNQLENALNSSGFMRTAYKRIWLEFMETNLKEDQSRPWNEEG